MIIEDKSTYTYQLRHLAKPSFEKIRNLAKDFIMKLPEQLKDELYEEIERGEKQLETEPELMYYLHAFGKMHKAKLDYAFEHLPETFFEIPEINIIDYGCGQAVATMCYADFLRKQGYEQKIRRVTLIEPSEAAVKRAALHVSVFFPDAEIKTVNKKFDDLTQDDIVCNEETPTLHILSNVLDMTSFDLGKFSELIRNCLKGHNQFVCVGPCIKHIQRDSRMMEFAGHFSDNIYCETRDRRELNPNKDWTCIISLFSVEAGACLLTNVMKKDLKEAIKDDYGVDGKKLLRDTHNNTNVIVSNYQELLKEYDKVLADYNEAVKEFDDLHLPPDCPFPYPSYFEAVITKDYTIKSGTQVICDGAFEAFFILRRDPYSTEDYSSSILSISIPNSVTI